MARLGLLLAAAGAVRVFDHPDDQAQPEDDTGGDFVPERRLLLRRSLLRCVVLMASSMMPRKKTREEGFGFPPVCRRSARTGAETLLNLSIRTGARSSRASSPTSPSPPSSRGAARRAASRRTGRPLCFETYVRRAFQRETGTGPASTNFRTRVGLFVGFARPFRKKANGSPVSIAFFFRSVSLSGDLIGSSDGADILRARFFLLWCPVLAKPAINRNDQISANLQGARNQFRNKRAI